MSEQKKQFLDLDGLKTLISQIKLKLQTKVDESDFRSHIQDLTSHVTYDLRDTISKCDAHRVSPHAPANAEPNPNLFLTLNVNGESVKPNTKVDTLKISGERGIDVKGVPSSKSIAVGINSSYISKIDNASPRGHKHRLADIEDMKNFSLSWSEIKGRPSIPKAEIIGETLRIG